MGFITAFILKTNNYVHNTEYITQKILEIT
jgi:hypothetical protein